MQKAYSILEANKDQRPRFWKETIEQLILLYQVLEKPERATEYQALLTDLQAELY